MLVLYTVGFSKGYIKDDVSYTKRFVELFWKQDIQQYQPHIEVIGKPQTRDSISASRGLQK